MSNIMFYKESKPIHSLKDKYNIDKKLSLQKEILKETYFNSVGLGEIKNKNTKVIK